MTVRSQLGRSRILRAGRDYARAGRFRAVSRSLAGVSFEKLPASLFVELTYQVLLRRRPDQVGYQNFVTALTHRRMSRGDVVQYIRGSEEFANQVRFSGPMLAHSIHSGRCQFIRSLPPARRIVDLGGTHLARDIGAMVESEERRVGKS